MTLTEKKYTATMVVNNFKKQVKLHRHYIKQTKRDIKARKEGRPTECGRTVRDLRFVERDLKDLEQMLEMMTEYRKYLNTLKKKPKKKK